MAESISTEERILSAASQQKDLLKNLADTDHAKSALQQNTSYQKSLTDEIAAKNKEISQLKANLAKEQRDHEKYRDSHVKRLAYKLGGQKDKFDAKASKEEREYLDAVQANFSASRQLDSLTTTLAAARKSHADLEAVLKRHNTAQADLNALYNAIFEGPTPEYPEEDAKEYPVQAAETVFNNTQLQLSREAQALQILLQAQQSLKQAFTAMKSALSASEWDIYSIGGGYADYAERSTLALAQMHVAQTENLAGLARQTQPLVRAIPHMDIVQGSWISDVVFDNIFSDVEFHRRIEGSMNQVIRAAVVMKEEVERSDGREEGLRGEVERARGRLEGARVELMKVRAEVFERVAGGLPAYSGLPAYEE